MTNIATERLSLLSKCEAILRSASCDRKVVRRGTEDFPLASLLGALCPTWLA